MVLPDTVADYRPEVAACRKFLHSIKLLRENLNRQLNPFARAHPPLSMCSDPFAEPLPPRQKCLGDFYFQGHDLCYLELPAHNDNKIQPSGAVIPVSQPFYFTCSSALAKRSLFMIILALSSVAFFLASSRLTALPTCTTPTMPIGLCASQT